MGNPGCISLGLRDGNSNLLGLQAISLTQLKCANLIATPRLIYEQKRCFNLQLLVIATIYCILALPQGLLMTPELGITGPASYLRPGSRLKFRVRKGVRETTFPRSAYQKLQGLCYQIQGYSLN